MTLSKRARMEKKAKADSATFHLRGIALERKCYCGGAGTVGGLGVD